jgi:hypothetical protein
MQKIKINICKDFSPTPGPRYIKEGKFSGELFRQQVLYPKVYEAITTNVPFDVDLDGTAGYGTSFLEESFGGLIRIHGLPYEKIVDLMTLKSIEEDYLIQDVHEYLKDAHEESKQ